MIQKCAKYTFMLLVLGCLLMIGQVHAQATPGLVLPEERTTGLGCIPEGRTVSYECTVNDTTAPFPMALGSTIWKGSAFQCSSTSNQITLPHSQFSNGPVIFSCGGLVAKAVNVDRANFNYVSQLNLTTSIELNGTSIACFQSSTKFGSDIIKVGVLPPPPEPLDVIFTGSSLTVSWNSPSCPVDYEVSEYLLTVTGEGCGCVSMNVSSNTTSVTCSGWTAAGQTCSFKVRTVSQDCRLTSDPAIKEEILQVTCDPATLGENAVIDDTKTVTISNGLIVYNGTSIGSIAYGICMGDYTPGVKSSNRSCMSNGIWSGRALVCVSAPIQPCPQSSLKYLSFLTLLLLLGLILFVIGFLGGFIMKKRKVPGSEEEHIQMQPTATVPSDDEVDSDDQSASTGDDEVDSDDQSASTGDDEVDSDDQSASTGSSFELDFTEKPDLRVLCTDDEQPMSRSIDAVAYNNVAYFRPFHSTKIFEFDSRSKKWKAIPSCPVFGAALVFLPVHTDSKSQFILHTVGGSKAVSPVGESQYNSTERKLVGKLYRLNKEGKSWKVSKLYRPMREPRRQVTAVWIDRYLIVAGGRSEQGTSNTVELLNLLENSWSKATPLPHPVYRGSGCVVSFCLYILGGISDSEVTSAYKIPLDQLVDSQRDPELQKTSAFQPIKKPLFQQSAYVTISDHLVAIGGIDGSKCVHDVNVYDSRENDWKPLKNKLVKARCCCNAASFVQPPRLMVVGGYTETSMDLEDRSSSVEWAEYKLCSGK